MRATPPFLFAILAAILAATGPLRAHDPGLSSATVRGGGGGLALHAAFANGDAARLLPALDLDRDGALSAAEVARGDAVLAQFAAQCLCDGRPGELVAARIAGNRDLELDVRWTEVRRGAGAPAALELRPLRALAFGHRCYLAAVGERGTVADALLTPAAFRFAVPADLRAAAPAGFAQGLRFVGLGVEHILTGFDHLCFLFGLLVTGGRLRRAAATITAFSAAHSLTLAAAGLGLCRLPAAFVEPAIAASIVVVAAENLLRSPGRRWPLAFLFGLVHGFGFASVLQDLDVAGGRIALPLLSFNLGVELGQLAVAALLLPVIARLQRRGHGPRLVRWGSLAIAAAGAFWLLERVVGW